MIETSTLNAALFGYSQTRRDSYFESIMTVCVVVYNTIIRENIKLPNDENLIRDEFLNYLKCSIFKKKFALANLIFDKETSENTGRADIRVLPTKDEYVNDEAYYLIECKRLDNKNVLGKTGLNAEYIKNGICRYVYGYYSTFYNVNAMFGFVVEQMNITTNINNINSLLPNTYINQQKCLVNANATQNITYNDFANGYPYSYLSKHNHNSGKEITLYHLMFDFSKNIVP